MTESPFGGIKGALRHLVQPPQPQETLVETTPISESSTIDSWTLLDWAPLILETASYGGLAKRANVSREEVEQWWRSRLRNPVEERDRLMRLLSTGASLQDFAVTDEEIEASILTHKAPGPAAFHLSLTVEELSSWLAKRGRSVEAEFNAVSF